jgi:hypothetical protein
MCTSQSPGTLLFDYVGIVNGILATQYNFIYFFSGFTVVTCINSDTITNRMKFMFLGSIVQVSSRYDNHTCTNV